MFNFSKEFRKVEPISELILFKLQSTCPFALIENFSVVFLVRKFVAIPLSGKNQVIPLFLCIHTHSSQSGLVPHVQRD
jgi:hypothetical protein